MVGESASLFLATPHQTGKSTFSRRDLAPLLERSNGSVIYVDLWVDLTIDPGQLIRSCIGKAASYKKKAMNHGLLPSEQNHVVVDFHYITSFDKIELELELDPQVKCLGENYASSTLLHLAHMCPAPEV